MSVNTVNTVNSLLGEVLAYTEQGIVYLDEGDKEGSSTMLKVAEELIREAEKLDGAKRSELYPMAIDALQKFEAQFNAAESVSVKPTAPLGAPPSYKSTEVDPQHGTLDAQMLYWLPEGVQLVTIENGVTATPSPPTSLAIFAVEQPKKSDNLYPTLEAAHPNALIQVGPWVYPLNREMSAIMKNDLHTYVLPNPTEDHPDMFVGIILPPGIDKKLEDEFVFVLEEYAEVRKSSIVDEMSNEEKERTSERIAGFLLKSGQRFALGVQKAATRSESFINDRGSKYRSGMKPTEKPLNINPVLRHGVSLVYKGSKTFAKVTKSLLDTIGKVGVNIGTKLANSASGSSGGGRIIGSTATVIGGGVAGASVVWISLEDASRQLFRGFSNEAVEMVKVRYGEPASETSRQALHAAGHTTMSAFQLWDLGPRSVAGRVARKAGIQFVHGIGHKDSSAAIKELQSRVGDTDEKKEKK